MPVELLPFYGMGASTFGGLLMAWASLVKLRERSESRYQGVMLAGTLSVFAGFLMQSAFILGKHYTFGVLAEYGIVLVATSIPLAIVLYFDGNTMSSCLEFSTILLGL